MNMTPTLRVALVTALSLSAAWNPACAEAVPDLLDLPAQPSVRAEHSQMLGLSRAGDRLVAVGERGLILLSDDAGRHWRQASAVPVSVALTDVCFASPGEGWAVGHSGVILRSGDGGEHWDRQLDGRQVAQLVLQAAQARQAAGEEAAVDVRAAEYLVQDGPDKPFLGVACASGGRAWAVGAYGLAMATDDGGSRWQVLQERIANPRGKHLYRVHANGQRLLVAGEQGALFLSRDGGGHFEEITTPYDGTFFGALDLGHGRLLAYGLRGNLWRSGDDGASWERLALPSQASLGAALVMADGRVLLSNDSGQLLAGDAAAQGFEALPRRAAGVPSAIAQAGDGSLALAGSHGVQRLESAREGDRP